MSVIDKKVKQLAKEAGSCFECNNPANTWASIPLGIFLCISCAGEHRSFGTHLSFVRSITLDKITEKDVLFLELGGHLRLRQFLKSDLTVGDLMDLPMRKRYEHPLAEQYRQELKQKVYSKLEIPLDPEVPKAPQKSAPPTQKSISSQSISNTNFPLSDFSKENEDEKPCCGCCLIV